MDYDELDLENVALDIRKYFLGYKKNQLKKARYKPHPNHDTPEVWKKAAVKCKELDGDPLSFVEAAFRNCKQAGPFPKQLGSKAMNRWYSEFERADTEENTLTAYESDIKSEMNTAANICYAAFIQGGVPIEDSLSSNLVRINGYVRIFLMPESEQVLNKFREQALKEIQENPGLYEALENLGMDLSIIFE